MKWSIIGMCLWVSVGGSVPLAIGQDNRTDHGSEEIPAILFDTPEKDVKLPSIESRTAPAKPAPSRAPSESTSPSASPQRKASSKSSAEIEFHDAKPATEKTAVAKPALVVPPVEKRALAKKPMAKASVAKAPVPTTRAPVAPVAKTTDGKPSLVIKTPIKDSLGSQPQVATPSPEMALAETPNDALENDALELVDLVSSADVSGAAEIGSVPESFADDMEEIPGSTSAEYSSDCSSTSSSCGSGTCGHHGCRRCRHGHGWGGMRWGQMCDDRCSPHWRGCYDVRRPGSDVYQHMNAQVMNGLAAQMILYRYDFVDDEGNEVASLSRRGKVQLDKIMGRWQTYGSPIVIEPTKNDQLDQQRRDEVLRQMADWGEQVDPDMVVVGRPNPSGLAGPEAELIYGNMLQQTQSRGGGGGGGNQGNSNVGNIYGGFGGGGSNYGGNGSSW